MRLFAVPRVRARAARDALPRAPRAGVEARAPLPLPGGACASPSRRGLRRLGPALSALRRNPSPRRPLAPKSATPSKICARARSSRRRRRPSLRARRPATRCCAAAGRRGGVQRPPFSARAGSAGTLRHASFRLPTSMATALLSSPARGFPLCAPPRPLIPARGSARLARAAYQRPPTRRAAARAFAVRGSPRPLYRAPRARAGCPAGHFAGNQLPGRSMGLSPLRPPPGTDLHVRPPRSLCRSFPRRRSRQA